MIRGRISLRSVLAGWLGAGLCACGQLGRVELGREVAIARHMRDGEEYHTPVGELIAYGRRLFEARWTIQEGAGRPMCKGTGAALTDATEPLVFPRAFNRVSGPDANSCAGCHNIPYAGGSGEFVTNAMVMAQRFDFADFDGADRRPARCSVDERGRSVTLEDIGDSRRTPALYGAGFIEMLAREMTADLVAIRDSVPLGGSAELVTKGIHFGVLQRGTDGSWDTGLIEGLPMPSLASRGPRDPPDLAVRPWGQSGQFRTLREFTVNAFNQHHGMQPVEMAGAGTDPDGDGVKNELTRADITAVVLFEAALPVPAAQTPKSAAEREAAALGRREFRQIGCAECHVPLLPLGRRDRWFVASGPYDGLGSLRGGDKPVVSVDLTSAATAGPRLRPDSDGGVWVPAFTDLKLHDITSGPGDPNAEPVDPGRTPGTAAFFAGNRRFLTRRLWGVASTPPYFHHGQFTTMREAVLAHSGEALRSRMEFGRLGAYERDAVIEFLKTLVVR